MNFVELSIALGLAAAQTQGSPYYRGPPVVYIPPGYAQPMPAPPETLHRKRNETVQYCSKANDRLRPFCRQHFKPRDRASLAHWLAKKAGKTMAGLRFVALLNRGSIKPQHCAISSARPFRQRHPRFQPSASWTLSGQHPWSPSLGHQRLV
jgi:hypothetical protein